MRGSIAGGGCLPRRSRVAADSGGCGGPLDLAVEQLLLDQFAEGVATQAAVGPEDPVAGDQHGDRIAAERRSDGADCVGPMDHGGDLRVGAGLACWDTETCLPDGLLERGGALEVESQLVAAAGRERTLDGVVEVVG